MKIVSPEVPDNIMNNLQMFFVGVNEVIPNDGTVVLTFHQGKVVTLTSTKDKRVFKLK